MSLVNLDALVPDPVTVVLDGKQYMLPRHVPTEKAIVILKLMDRITTKAKTAIERYQMFGEATALAASYLAALTDDPQAAQTELQGRLTPEQAIEVLHLALNGPPAGRPENPQTAPERADAGETPTS